ncbi:hypothetical protein [Corynebacterium sp.]|uniref:hypothetical protein n=1 Tax=Corynebacterium sp. TaxID=1720 RepID=UPI0026DFC23F|nr:hypothetical protein [Corynebacterium sp.]MDO5511817.1 hypothetical protein [Corynebacterium sp.]
MKLLSRKAIAAVATTVALTTAGLSAPAFAQVSSTPDNNVIVLAQDEPGEGEGDTETPEAPAEEGSSFAGSSEDMEAKEIREWVGVFTAVIGALSAAFVFVQRLGN